LYDLGGNVWEWCEDTYSGGTDANASRVLRGGSWRSIGSWGLLSSCRDGNHPGIRNVYYGFRVVLGVSSP
jgi:formylglycine-generating enzyme required for sulfatase activity